MYIFAEINLKIVLQTIEDEVSKMTNSDRC